MMLTKIRKDLKNDAIFNLQTSNRHGITKLYFITKFMVLLTFTKFILINVNEILTTLGKLSTEDLLTIAVF